MVESRKASSVLWLHNDSGDSARLFATKTNGASLGIYSIAGATNIDWEDIAIGPGPTVGEHYLYIGDIGDNDLSRTTVQLYRVAEPEVDPTAGSMDATISGVEKFELSYPAARYDAETLMVDPTTGDVFIVTKPNDGPSLVFRAAAPLTGITIALEQVGQLDFDASPLDGKRATGGDISADGATIAIRTNTTAFSWQRNAGQSVAEALADSPCRLPIKTEDQGESFAFAASGSGYYTTSEGEAAPIHFYPKQ